MGVDREPHDACRGPRPVSASTTGSGSTGRWAQADGPAHRSRCTPECAGRRRRRRSRTTRWPGSAQEAAAWHLLDLAVGTCPVLTSTSQSNTVDMLRARPTLPDPGLSQREWASVCDRGRPRQPEADSDGRRARTSLRFDGQVQSCESGTSTHRLSLLPFGSREETDDHPVRATSQQRRRSVAPGQGMRARSPLSPSFMAASGAPSTRSDS